MTCNSTRMPPLSIRYCCTVHIIQHYHGYILRTAKSGSSWTKNELDAYRMTLNELDLDEELLCIIDAGPMKQDHHAKLITYVDRVTIHDKGEAAVPDFVVELFDLLAYEQSRAISM